VGDTYDIVLLNGRVIDPESGIDAIRNVGINGSRVAAVTTEVIRGTTTIRADGLVVAPGFIDLHQHARLPINAVNYVFKVMDGVTSSLELEIGTADVAGWYAARAGRALVNYGVSVGHAPIRMAVMGDTGEFLPSGPAGTKVASEAEIAEMRRRFELGLRQGAVAAGFGLAYTPAASHWELLEMFKLAGEARVSAHVHTRGTAGVGLLEAIALAAVTGTPLQIVHVQSTGGAETPQVMEAIRQARAHGLDVTAETYPYIAGASQIESVLFSNWESYPDERFQQYLWPPTGERLTRETFAKYRKTGGLVITFTNTEPVIISALADPLTMVASDGNNTPGEPQHPRTAGTFARVLGHYVREEKTLSLLDALRKMTLMPAQRLERRVPAMANKGRIRVGADADLTLFDPATIIDRATYEKPAQYSEGIKDVIVNGVVVVRDGRPLLDVYPGQPIRAPQP
jgi:dihydroorotase